MQYSLEKISTVDACNTLLASAQKKKQTLERRRRNLGESIDTFRERMDKMNQESTLVLLSLEALAVAYQTMPESKYKADLNIKIKRLEVRQAMLAKKAYTYNVASLLVKEIKYHVLDSQVSAIENYIASVHHRRMALGKAAMPISQAATALRPSVAAQRQPVRVVPPKQQAEENAYSFRAPDRVDGAAGAPAGVGGMVKYRRILLDLASNGISQDSRY